MLERLLIPFRSTSRHALGIWQSSGDEISEEGWADRAVIRRGLRIRHVPVQHIHFAEAHRCADAQAASWNALLHPQGAESELAPR